MNTNNKILNLLKKSDKLFDYKNFKNIDFNDEEYLLNYYKTLIEQSYLNKESISLSVPRFLQEFIYIFYLSLKIMKNYYKDDSYIICLGESPAKFIMTQSFFYDDIEMKKILGENNYPKNLTFKYLPLSGLGYFSKNSDTSSPEFETLYVTQFLKPLTERIYNRLNSEFILKYFKYFKKHLLDPETIINSNKKNYIFLDRTESFSSITVLFIIYKKIIDLLDLNKNEIKKFIKKIKIVGFDINVYSTEKKQKKIINLKKIFDILFSSHDKNIINFMKLDEIDFKDKIKDEIKDNFKNNNLNKNKSNRLIEKGFKLFDKHYTNLNIPLNIILFFTIPERRFIDSRCVKGMKLQSNSIELKKIKEININKIKNNKDSDNCNVCNYILFEIFLKCKELNQENISLLEYLIKNLDNVDINKISYLSKESFDPLLFFDENITEDNIKENILNNKKYIKNTIFDKDVKYLIPLNIDEKKNNILYIDFNILLIDPNKINLSLFKINQYNYKWKNTSFLEDTLKYHFRPGYKDFFIRLKKLKDEKKIDKIYMLLEYNKNNYSRPDIKIIYKHIDNNNIIDETIDKNEIYQQNKYGYFYNETKILNLDIKCNNNCDKIYHLTDQCILTLPEKKCIKIKSFNGIKINHEEYTDIIQKYIKNNKMRINEFEEYYKSINNPNKTNDNELLRVSKIIEDLFNDEYKNINNINNINNNLEENKSNIIKQNILSNQKLNNILCLDFDETLGSFQFNYSMYSIILNKYVYNNNIKNEILKELLINYYMRPGLDIFFQELKKMKDSNMINKILVISRNVLVYHNNYFKDTINLMEDISNCNGLIDEIRTNISIKNLLKIKKEYNGNKIFIIDDKCEHTIPEENCIKINPYFVYEHYSIFIDILKRYCSCIPIDLISTELETYISKNSIVYQYSQIENIKKLYGPNKNNKVKKYDDKELDRVLKIIKEKYEE